MPGPVYVPGAKLPHIQPPPKPVTKAEVLGPPVPDALGVTLPADVLASWRGLWHALGSNLPWYVNHARTSRKALRTIGRTYG